MTQRQGLSLREGFLIKNNEVSLDKILLEFG